MAKTPGRPRDPNQLAKFIVDAVTSGEVAPAPKVTAISAGRPGGLKGGPARAQTLTPQRRSQIAAKAASARWKKPPEKARGE